MFEKKYEYDYPKYEGTRRLNLEPGSELHDKIVGFVTIRADEGEEDRNARRSKWRAIENMLNHQMPIDSEELDALQQDSRTPVSIEVPTGSIVEDTTVGFVKQAVLQRPIVRLGPVGPEDVLGVIQLEHVVNQQLERAEVEKEIGIFIKDAVRYDVAALLVRWESSKHEYNALQEAIGNDMFGGTILLQGAPKVVERKMRTIEGIALDRIDPFNFIVDSYAHLDRIQEAPFVGYVETTTYEQLLANEELSDDQFNAKYLADLPGGDSKFNGRKKQSSDGAVKQRYIAEDLDTTLPHDLRYGEGQARLGKDTEQVRRVDVLHLWAIIIPEELGVGKSKLPEKWYFQLAADNVVLRAQPLGTVKDLYPIVVTCPNTDGHTQDALSKVGLIMGLRTVMNFMLNAFVRNNRQVMNTAVIYNPMMVVRSEQSKEDPFGPAEYHLTEYAMGSKISDVFQQIQLTDVTAPNVPNSLMLLDLIMRTTGTTDVLQGVPRRGSSDTSATEAAVTARSAASRLETFARQVAIQGISTLGRLVAQFVKDNMEAKQWLKITGGLISRIAAEYGPKAVSQLETIVQGNRMIVDPESIQVEFDVEITNDRGAMQVTTSELAQLMQVGVSIPPIAQGVDWLRLYGALLRRGGVLNAEDYFVNLEGVGGVPPEMMAPQDTGGVKENVLTPQPAGDIVQSSESGGLQEASRAIGPANSA